MIAMHFIKSFYTCCPTFLLLRFYGILGIFSKMTKCGKKSMINMNSKPRGHFILSLTVLTKAKVE